MIGVLLITIIAIIIIIFVATKSDNKKIIIGFCGLPFEIQRSESKIEEKRIADKLCEINQRILTFIRFLLKSDNKEYNSAGQILQREYQNDDIFESNIETYTVGKGDKISLYMKDISINELMFVMIHELAHVVTPEYNHTVRFWKNNIMLLEAGIKCGIYKGIDYYYHPFNYSSGIVVNNNPLYDREFIIYINNPALPHDKEIS